MRKVYRNLVMVVLALTASNTVSGQTIFDPVLDPTAQIKQTVDNGQTWESAYMWYPGQLAAYRQQWLREQSKNRCVNVGYPGKFNAPAEVTYFKQTCSLKQPTEIHWQAALSQAVTVTLDGKEVSGNGTLSIPKGKHTLLFKVTTHQQLPALIVEGLPQEGWLAGLNESQWAPVESDARFNQPNLSPNRRINQQVTVGAKQLIPIKNATVSNGIALNKNGTVLIDFFHNEVGVVELTAEGTGKLHFIVGESTEEVFNEDTKLFEQRPIPDVELASGTQSILLPERALRYLKVSATQQAHIKEVKFHTFMWPVQFDFAFDSSDKLLNDMVNAGIATLHTSLHDFNLDGIRRDFLPWSMDEVISMIGLNVTFSDRMVARNNISIALMPANPQISDWGIVDYPLHALIGLKLDYLRYGDLTTVEMYRDRIFGQLDFYAQQQDERGFISAAKPSSGFIPGWSRDNGPDDYGIAAYPQMMLYENFRIGAFFADKLKDRARAKDYRQRAEKLKDNIMQHFWDESKYAFINGYRTDGSKDERISHHAQYWSVLTDLYPAAHYNELFDKVIPSIPNYKGNISYEKGYEAFAYFKAGRTADFRNLLNEVWGDWLQQGYTRFPENFSVYGDVAKQLTFYNRPYGLSLCHGANGVPPIALAVYGIFGFSQSDSKPNQYTLAPNLMDLSYAQGRFPVKEGIISLRVTPDKIEVEIPAGCEVKVQTATGVTVLKRAGKYSL